LVELLILLIDVPDISIFPILSHPPFLFFNLGILCLLQVLSPVYQRRLSVAYFHETRLNQL